MPFIGSLEVLSNSSGSGDLGAQTAHGLPIGEGAGTPLSWTAPPTAGQILIGVGANSNPVLGNITGAGGTTVANGPGSIAISSPDLGAQTTFGVAIGAGQNAPLNWVTLSNGQLLVGTAGNPLGKNLIASGSITITQTASAITIGSSGGGTGFSWNEVSGGTVAMMPNNGYIVTGATTLTLPVSATLGQEIRVVGAGALWSIGVNLGQTVYLVTSPATTSLSATTPYDTLDIISVDSMGTNYVVTATQGNVNIV